MRSVTIRLLIFNILVLFVPLGSLMFLDTYEKQLLASQENAMVHQARIVSAALKDSDLPDSAPDLIEALELTLESRIRVIDNSGKLLADTATYGLSEQLAQQNIARQKVSMELLNNYMKNDLNKKSSGISKKSSGSSNERLRSDSRDYEELRSDDRATIQKEKSPEYPKNNSDRIINSADIDFDQYLEEEIVVLQDEIVSSDMTGSDNSSDEISDRESEENTNSEETRNTRKRDARQARESILYILSVSPINFIKDILGEPDIPLASGDYYNTGNYLAGVEIQKALKGNYGATARYSSNQRSIQLYSALPIYQDEEVSGVTLISQSTYKLLSNLYRIRLDLIKVFFWSVLLSIAFSIILSLTITRPLHKLRNQAEQVLDARGSLVGTIEPLRVRDEIGDLSRSLATLSERLKDKIYFIDNFTADMLHELKNPLAAIKTSAEIVLDDVTPDQRNVLVRISKESLRIEQLLSRLREVTRIDSQLDEDSVENYDIVQLLLQRVDHYRSLCKPKCNFKFTCKEREDTARCELNSDRFYQIIDNLIDNSIGFTKEGSTIELSLILRDRKILVSVSDEGPGISEGDIDKIFTRFFSSRKPGTSHSGLGLSIAFAIAAAYGGTIQAGNRKEGGAVMTLILPLAKRKTEDRN